MSEHFGHQEGCRICDELFSYMKSRNPDLERRHKPKACRIHIGKHSPFAWIYHHKLDSHLTVYFREDPLRTSYSIENVTVTRREKLDKQWAKNYPAFLRLDDISQVNAVADFL